MAIYRNTCKQCRGFQYIFPPFGLCSACIGALATAPSVHIFTGELGAQKMSTTLTQRPKRPRIRVRRPCYRMFLPNHQTNRPT